MPFLLFPVIVSVEIFSLCLFFDCFPLYYYRTLAQNGFRKKLLKDWHWNLTFSFDVFRSVKHFQPLLGLKLTGHDIMSSTALFRHGICYIHLSVRVMAFCHSDISVWYVNVHYGLIGTWQDCYGRATMKTFALHCEGDWFHVRGISNFFSFVKGMCSS